MEQDAAFICRMDPGDAKGPLVAVKDLIDVKGTLTTAASRVVATGAKPAESDAPCMAGARSADARIVGKTNLVELALGVSGINPWFGTPINPLDPTRIPGGSSSGSAVVVATGQAQVAYGSDTGGSIRMPAACCGVVGLKTTFGRVSLERVWPLAPSLDTVGPMARNVADVVLGMQLLEPGFQAGHADHYRVGRLLLPASPAVDRDVDAALHAAGFAVDKIEMPDWSSTWESTMVILEHEASVSNEALLERLDEIDPAVAVRLQRGAGFSDLDIEAAREVREVWKHRLGELLATYDVLVAPTLPDTPPLLSEAGSYRVPHLSPVNFALLPAIALPVGHARPIPASVQVIGPMNGEERIVDVAAVIEASAG